MTRDLCQPARMDSDGLQFDVLDGDRGALYYKPPECLDIRMRGLACVSFGQLPRGLKL
jgi:hypothetical protein